MNKTIHSEVNARLIKWLKAKRLESGLTIRDLAKLLNRHHSIIGKIETGERRLDVVEYLAYCSAMSADPIEGINNLKNK